MKKNKLESSKLTNLFRQAEKEVKKSTLDSPENLPSVLMEDTQGLMHDLKVHQIELEMQNEELRLAQWELEKSHARFFELYNSAPFAYLTLDQNSQIQEINHMGSQLLGRKKSDLINSPLTRFIVSEDQDVFYLYFKHLHTVQEQKTCELRLVKKDGSRFWVQMGVTAVQDSEIGTDGYRVVIMDITERKQMEELRENIHLELEKKVKKRTVELEEANYKLKKSEEQFQQMVEFLPVSIFLHNKKEIVFANSEALNLVHSANKQVFNGQSFTAFIDLDDKEMFIEKLSEVITEKVSLKSFTTKVVQMTGTVIEVELFLTPFCYQGDLVVQMTAYNMTKRKKREAELSKVEKLDSISILAGGIAHDFNNHLTVLLGNISMAMSNISDPEQLGKFLSNAKEATLQTKNLASQLLIFSKEGEPIKEVVAMDQLIMECTSFALSGSNVTSHFSIPEDLLLVEVDKGQITQVLYNIIINAVQALVEGGSIYVKVENVTIDPQSDNSTALSAGEYVKVSIEDDGPGIPENSLQKIFDPFYTTKENGSGIGLAGAYNIIKNHHGCIKAESEVGKGTVLSFIIPASLKVNEVIKKNSNVIYGTGKILLMDDEKAIREIVGQMLIFMGYEPHFAREGKEAIEVYLRAKEMGQPFDVVILDMTIKGGMSGKDTIKELLAIDPEVKAIVASGYSKDLAISKYRVYGFKGAAKKPFSIEELSKIVNEVISKSVI